MLRLVRRGTNRGKLKSARFLLRLLGQRFGQVRVLLDAWFMRGWLITRTLADGHTVIGCVRRDLALSFPNWWTPLLSSDGSGKVSNGPGTASFYG